MEHPYMPVGEVDHEGQKRNVIKEAIAALKPFEEDINVKMALECLVDSLKDKS